MSEIIAAIQLNSNAVIQDNLARIEFWVEKASQAGAKVVLLPENALYMAEVQGQSKSIAEPLGNGKVQTTLGEYAQKHQVWLLVGAFPTIDKESTFQTLLVYNDKGDLVEHYHKRHLFNVTLPDTQESYRESDAFEAGSEYKVIDTPVGKIGLAICYDLRFPEQFRNLVEQGAEVFVLPAAFTYVTGKAHWETLLRSRAIENLCYVLAAGQTGKHPGGRETWGHSMIVSPWGTIVDCLPEEEGFVMATIDREEQQRQRTVFPALSHRV